MRQMQKIIMKVCNKGVNAKQISKHAFDLILSFDDLITTNGYRDSVTMSQLESYLDMDSTDEKMHKKMRMIREKEAKEIAKKHQKEIAKKTKLEAKLKREGGVEETTDSKGFGSSDFPTSTVKKSKLNQDPVPTRAPTGKGMQLGKAKAEKLPQLSKAFDFGSKAQMFPEAEETKEEKKPAKSSQVVHLKIEELVN